MSFFSSHPPITRKLFSDCIFSEVEQILIETSYTKKIPMSIKITSVLL